MINMTKAYIFKHKQEIFTYDYYLKQKYGSKVLKVAIDGGFTCRIETGKLVLVVTLF